MRIYISLLVLTVFFLGTVLFVFDDDNAASETKAGVQAYQLANGMKIRVIATMMAFRNLPW